MSTPYGPGPGYYPQRDHPSAITSLILGILGLVICPLTAPFAWSIGGKAVKEIDQSAYGGSPLGGRGQAQAGRILGIIGTVYLILLVLFFAIIAIVAIGVGTSSS